MFKMGCSMARKILAIDGKGSSSSAVATPDAGLISSVSGDNSGSGSGLGSSSKRQVNKLMPTGESSNNNNSKKTSGEEINDFSKLEADPRIPLNVRQIFKITKSWKAIARTMSKTGTAMFLNLFEQNKDLFYLFDRFQHLKGKDLHESMELREHAATVMSTLDQSISSLSDYDNFVTYLHSIGELHRKVPDFKRSHFWKIEQPFLIAVKQTLDERCNETIEEIYRIAIKLIIETIADGYGDDKPASGEGIRGDKSSSNDEGRGGARAVQQQESHSMNGNERQNSGQSSQGGNSQENSKKNNDDNSSWRAGETKNHQTIYNDIGVSSQTASRATSSIQRCSCDEVQNCKTCKGGLKVGSDELVKVEESKMTNKNCFGGGLFETGKHDAAANEQTSVVDESMMPVMEECSNSPSSLKGTLFVLRELLLLLMAKKGKPEVITSTNTTIMTKLESESEIEIGIEIERDNKKTGALINCSQSDKTNSACNLPGVNEANYEADEGRNADCIEYNVAPATIKKATTTTCPYQQPTRILNYTTATKDKKQRKQQELDDNNKIDDLIYLAEGKEFVQTIGQTNRLLGELEEEGTSDQKNEFPLAESPSINRGQRTSNGRVCDFKSSCSGLSPRSRIVSKHKLTNSRYSACVRGPNSGYYAEYSRDTQADTWPKCLLGNTPTSKAKLQTTLYPIWSKIKLLSSWPANRKQNSANESFNQPMAIYSKESQSTNRPIPNSKTNNFLLTSNRADLGELIKMLMLTIASHNTSSNTSVITENIALK